MLASNTNNLLSALNQLREMGFNDELKNKQILVQTQGSIEAAIEILSRSTTTTTFNHAPNTPPITQQFLTDDQKIEQLIKLGFLDKNSNIDALRRSGGNMDIAMTILNETKNILQQKGFAGQTQQHQEPFRSNSVPVLSNQLLIDVDSTPTAASSISNGFSNPFATVQVQQQQQQPLQIQYPMQPQPQPQPFMYQQQQQQPQPQQQPQQQLQNNLFSNPFGLATTTSSTTNTTSNCKSQCNINSFLSNSILL